MSTKKSLTKELPGTERRFSASGDFIERLEGRERREAIPRDDIIPRLGLSRIDIVVDLGSGIGYFTFAMAETASEIVAIDIEPKMLEVLSSRIETNRTANVSPVRGEMTDLPLADSSADFVLAAFVFHEVSDHSGLLMECARVLKASGHLVVIDFQKHDTPIGPPVSERKTPEHVLKKAKPWFRLDSRYETDVFYLLRLAKT